MKVKVEFDTKDDQKNEILDLEVLPQKGHVIRWRDNQYYRVSEIVFEEIEIDSNTFIPVVHVSRGYEMLRYETDPKKLSDQYS